MTFDEYTERATTTAPHGLSWHEQVHNALLGMCGESGELADLFKKHLYQGHDLSNEDVKSELGDALWYVNAMARAMGWTLEEVAQANIGKLKARYPEGKFNSERSINRTV